MNIRGLYKTSLLDFPGKISAVIFTGGCNLRCGYCHNPHLVIDPESHKKLDETEIINFLIKRKGLLDSVTISGGEPLLQKGLLSFMERVKESTGMMIKLDTNGSLPGNLKSVAGSGLLDYVALDIKTSPAKYPGLTGVDFKFENIIETLSILRDRGIDFEIRTTCVPGYVAIDDISLIGCETGRVSRYYLQQYVVDNDLISGDFMKIEPYGIDYLQLLRTEALKFSDNCVIRGA